MTSKNSKDLKTINSKTKQIEKIYNSECKKKDIIYFDNNGTTVMSPQAIKVLTKWAICYNASTDSKVAKPAKQILEKAINIILDHCNVNNATHKCIFTSGATESNNYIIRACVKAYQSKIKKSNNTNILPHIIISAIEHSSIIECVNDLKDRGEIDLSIINPTIYGNILSQDIEKEIKINTCLICVMYANNELPIINNIKSIGDIAHKYKIPLHSDCVQIFGKIKMDINNLNIDSLSASFHKFYGPKGIGLLIMSNELINGYELKAEISGSQQYHLRGGTENIAGIASGITALQNAFINRKKKNENLYKLRLYCLNKLKGIYKFNDIKDYIYDNNSVKSNLEIVNLGPPESKKDFILPNTILLSICKNKGIPFCNINFKKDLDNKNCIISIGSACLTNSDKASHVLSAIEATPVMKRGTIRISFGDNNTIKEINKFVELFKICIDKQCKDINNYIKT
jgi:cysteine desulfurase